ncbi:MAG: hypothetical protein PHV68_10435 [Candidatus Gastranaerophilales bacterium]|nr:hypothetical protein [Candidatus Gastranaerophilales bacterium]
MAWPAPGLPAWGAPGVSLGFSGAGGGRLSFAWAIDALDDRERVIFFWGFTGRAPFWFLGLFLGFPGLFLGNAWVSPGLPLGFSGVFLGYGCPVAQVPRAASRTMEIYLAFLHCGLGFRLGFALNLRAAGNASFLYCLFWHILKLLEKALSLLRVDLRNPRVDYTWLFFTFDPPGGKLIGALFTEIVRIPETVCRVRSVVHRHHRFIGFDP